METLNLFTIISRLINQNKAVRAAKLNSENEAQASSVIQECLLPIDRPTNLDVIPVTRQLALEQIRFLN